MHAFYNEKMGNFCQLILYQMNKNFLFLSEKPTKKYLFNSLSSRAYPFDK